MALGHVAVVGGGINGLCVAWELARRGWQVELFERERCLAQTSSASTKLLHGGLRYLEQGHLWLVAESLRERARWLREVPQHCHWLPLLLPIYRQQLRSPWQLQLGLGLYDGLSLGRVPGFARWLEPSAVLDLQPQLLSDGLLGAWQFWDGPMDERALGRWVMNQTRCHGVVIHEGVEVTRLSSAGWLEARMKADSCVEQYHFSWIVNACGPWAVRLLQNQALPLRCSWIWSGVVICWCRRHRVFRFLNKACSSKFLADAGLLSSCPTKESC